MATIEIVDAENESKPKEQSESKQERATTNTVFDTLIATTTVKRKGNTRERFFDGLGCLLNHLPLVEIGNLSITCQGMNVRLEKVRTTSKRLLIDIIGHHKENFEAKL
jgi:hypothetical protein